MFSLLVDIISCEILICRETFFIITIINCFNSILSSLYFRYEERNSNLEPEPPITLTSNQERVHYRKFERKDNGVQRFKTTDKTDLKRRSMYSLIEDEHRRSSQDIAKELKRRSYMETSYDDTGYGRDHSYRDSSEHGKSKSSYEPESSPSRRNRAVPEGYLHSYLDAKRTDKNVKNHYSEVLHRNTSSLSNNSRVGIASVHPY